MSMLNQASFLINLAKIKITKKPAPLTVIYNITDRCNAACKYCYLKYYQRGIPEPTTTQIFKVVDELKKMGNRRISLAGGEPLVRQDIGEVINYIKERGIDCVVNTNGILVPAKINELKKVDVLCISLDGPADIHDLYRGVGSYDKAFAAITAAREKGIAVNTNTVLNQSNLSSIKFILELAKQYGFLAEFNLMIGYLPDKSTNIEKPTDDQIKTALKEIIEYKKNGYPVLMSKKAYEYALAWPTYSIEEIWGKDPNFLYVKCSAGKFFCSIDTDGCLYACPHLIGKVPALSAYEVGVTKSFELLQNHDCRACYQVYHSEFHLLYKLDPEIIFNHFKNSLKSIIKK